MSDFLNLTVTVDVDAYHYHTGDTVAYWRMQPVGSDTWGEWRVASDVVK